MSFLLDTDICSAYLKGDHRVGNRFIQYGGRLHVSVITVAELFAWVLRANASPARLPGLLNLLRDVQCLEVNLAVARKFGEVRALQTDVGHHTPAMDLLIASTALIEGLTLVTHNVQDFTYVPDLSVTDWLAP